MAKKNPAANDVPIALALSGGGIRAMMFHLGVLRYLAERRAMERVRRVSTVSGGSLVIGLMLKENAYVWPDSASFLASIYPALRSKLCERSLQWGALREFAKPSNWRFVFSRANLLALALNKEWGVTAPLGDLPVVPELSINGTTAENGKRFRFKRDSFGDYELGYAPGAKFPLASALAVSAAFPGGFGPLTLDADAYDWWRRDGWNNAAASAREVDIGYRRLHLYDGGVYDNLGLEPLFDAGRGEPRHAGEFLMVSDAGAPLRPGFTASAVSPWRLKRVADIMSDQSRSLRIRTYLRYLELEPDRGAFLHINEPVHASRAEDCASASFAARYPTTLRRPTLDDFDAISEHGYQLCGKFDRDPGSVPRAAARPEQGGFPGAGDEQAIPLTGT